MEDLIRLLVGAVTNASVYALVAFSLVLVHRGSGVLNFGVGFMAVFSGLFFANALGGDGGWAAAALALVVGGLVGLGAYGAAVAVGQRRGADHVSLAIATLGFGLVLEYLATVFWEERGFTVPPMWSGSFQLMGVNITYQRLLTALVALACFVAVMVLLEKTLLGWALESVAHNAETAGTYGVPVTLALVTVWVLGGIVAALAGTLVTPLSSIALPLAIPLVVKGFASAVLGGLGSVTGAVYGALVVSVAEALFIRYVSSAYSNAFAFLLLFLVLAIRPEGIVGDRRQIERT